MLDEHKDLKHRISLLLDGELDGRGNPRLLDRLEEDEELKVTWGRYNLIGEVMRAPRAHLADGEFAKRVSAAIRDEPTVMAPRQKSQSDNTTVRHRIVTAAMAASLAGVAILIGKSLTDNADELLKVYTQPQVVVAANEKASELDEKMAEAQFNDYLLVHNETAYLAGTGGMLPHVRLVSYRADH